MTQIYFTPLMYALAVCASTTDETTFFDALACIDHLLKDTPFDLDDEN